MTTTAVLFDLDDTLFDHQGCTRAALGALQIRYAPFRAWSFDALDAAHRALLEALHLEVLAGRLSVDEARVRRFKALVEQAGGEATDAVAAGIAAEYREVYVAHWQPVRGALALLQVLHGRVATGVVTNNVAAEQHQKIDACGFRPWLDAVIISEEAGVSKPDPRIFEIALARLGRPAAAAVMVGDAWGTDIAGALGAGIRPVWFSRVGAPSPNSAVAEIHALEPAESVAEFILNPRPLGAEASAKAAESRVPSPESLP